MLTFNMPFGKVIFVQTVVSEAPLTQRVTHYLYGSWWIPAFIATQLSLQGVAIQARKFTQGNYRSF